MNRRKFEVVFVERIPIQVTPISSDGTASPSQFTHTWMKLAKMKGVPPLPVGEGLPEPPRGKGGEREIEEDIVRELCKRHESWIKSGEEKK